jgi:putative molybdopterin biosynthesis protein
MPTQVAIRFVTMSAIIVAMKSEAAVRNNLRPVRTRLGLSQQELAQAAGITRQTIGGIEGGLYAPSAAVALRLARALGCRMEDLFWLDEETRTLTATPAGELGAEETRVSLAQVGGRWVAHPLRGEEAFRTEMVPCDGFATLGSGGVRVRLLDDPDALARTVSVAGCTPVLSPWARAAERWYPGLRVHWTFANSSDALAALDRGEVHAAGVHLSDPATGEHNTPFVREALRGRDVLLVNLGTWEEGLVVAVGNPRKLARGADLSRRGVRIVNREPGAGARRLLEDCLREDGVPITAVEGFENIARSHEDVARAVISGADAGVSSAGVAAAFGLGFVPLREVRYDLAILKDYLGHEPVRQLLATLDHRWVRSQLSVLGGYDTARTGETVAEVLG